MAAGIEGQTTPSEFNRGQMSKVFVTTSLAFGASPYSTRIVFSRDNNTTHVSESECLLHDNCDHRFKGCSLFRICYFELKRHRCKYVADTVNSLTETRDSYLIRRYCNPGSYPEGIMLEARGKPAAGLQFVGTEARRSWFFSFFSISHTYTDGIS